ncbi:MAG: hypothetical protein ACK4TI_00860 [Nitrososphaerales archaeon]
MKVKSNTRQVALATLFATLIFASKAALPTPIDKAAVVVQALMLTLGYLILGRLGATYVAVVGGLLTALLRPSFAPLTILFALIYGLLIDYFSSLLRVRSSKAAIKSGRLVLSVTISTGLVGLLSYYVTVLALGLLPRNPALEIIILLSGIVSGALAGWLAVVIWRRILYRFTLQVR